MLRLRISGPLACCFVASLTACDSQEEQRPPIGDFGGYSGGVVPGSGQGGAGGDGDEMPDGGGVLVASVNAFVDDSFDTTTSYDGDAQVSVFSQDEGSHVSATGPSSGVEVQGVEVSGERWIYTEAVDTAAYSPTLLSLDIGSGSIQSTLLPVVVLEGIFASFQSQTAINENAGHIALTIVDGNGDPLSGVELSFNSGGGVVSYRDGNAWFNLGEATGASGQIFIANEQAAAFPGQESRLIFTGAIDEEASVRVISGAVTVLTVVVP